MKITVSSITLKHGVFDSWHGLLLTLTYCCSLRWSRAG